MNITLTGTDPSSQQGEKLTVSPAWWHPLTQFANHVAPEIAETCRLQRPTGQHEHDTSNQDAKDLAQELRKAVESGEPDRWAEDQKATWMNKYEHHIGEIPGYWTMPSPEPRLTHTFNNEGLLRFADFLESCGGFSIR